MMRLIFHQSTFTNDDPHSRGSLTHFDTDKHRWYAQCFFDDTILMMKNNTFDGSSVGAPLQIWLVGRGDGSVVGKVIISV